MICTLVSWKTKVVTIYNPSLNIYEQLQKEYPTTLNCPCTTSSMPYKNFITTKIDMHQICSGDFISQEWINAFHIPDASRYGAMDFRTTANSQVTQYNRKFFIDYHSKYMFIVQTIRSLMYIST